VAENITIDSGVTKAEQYEQLLPQIQSLVGDETDEQALLASTAAALHHGFGFFWTGFYRVIENELVLGAFQGPVACMRIAYGRGVCGTAWKEGQSIIVPDVDQFPGHISCNSASRSEIVVPLKDKNSEVRAILDVDSNQLNAFDTTDQQYLEQIANWLSQKLF